MEKEKFSYPVSLRRMQITDKFWKNEMELVRTEVIPYQWNALNDKVEGAAPSYCMHNFKVAAEMNRQKRKQGAAYKEPSYIYRGFEMLPEDQKISRMSFMDMYFRIRIFKWVEAVGYSLTQHPDRIWKRLQMLQLILSVRHSRKTDIWTRIILSMEKMVFLPTYATIMNCTVWGI